MKRLFLVFGLAGFLFAACGEENVREVKESWEVEDESDEEETLNAQEQDDGEGENCTAKEWQGASFEENQCIEGEQEACENPFSYQDLEACCGEHVGAEGCEEAGDENCDAIFVGANVSGGRCVEGEVTGCVNPFPYDDLDACCAANPEVDNCGGQDHCDGYWTGASYRDGACVEEGASGCSNPFPYGDKAECCEAHSGATGCGSLVGEGGTCNNDNSCAEGRVCEANADGIKVCVIGCRVDTDCPDEQTCQPVQCLVPPCPDMCMPL